MSEDRNQQVAQSAQEQNEPKAKDNSKSGGGSYRMISHVETSVVESGKDEARYVDAYEPFYADKDEAFRLAESGQAKFASEEGEDGAEARVKAEEDFQSYLDEKAEAEAKEFAYLSSNELQPKSASANMLANAAAESNSMPAGSDPLPKADHSVHVQSDPLHDGTRGVFVDHEKVKEEHSEAQ